MSIASSKPRNVLVENEHYLGEVFLLVTLDLLLFHVSSPSLFIKKKKITYNLKLENAGTAADVLYLERATCDTQVGGRDFARSLLCVHGQY